jgi:uncharacterized cysteine cluster protein YcgN (CxxCxxCC family)
LDPSVLKKAKNNFLGVLSNPESLFSIFLTNVCCDKLDTKTKQCKDYNERDCPKLTYHRAIYEGYSMPACCAYVKKYIYSNNFTTPKIDWDNIITESEMKQRGETLIDHIISKTNKYFHYIKKIKNKNH